MPFQSMAEIIPFPKKVTKKTGSKKIATQKILPKKMTAESLETLKRENSHTLCKSGFHKWKADKNTDFAVKAGKLQTRYICERCGKIKTELT